MKTTDASGYLGDRQGKSRAGDSRNHREKNRSYLKRRGDQGSNMEHMWQGKPGLKSRGGE